MALAENTIASLAERVDTAARELHTIVKLTDEFSELDMQDAYTIQRRSMARRFERGEVLIGMKMGLTSVAKMKQMGVEQPIYGHLTDVMLRQDGDTLSMGDFIHPRCEPEIAFILSRDLRGPVSPAQAMLAVEGICAAIEVIDSRYEKFKFTLADVVADNASSVAFVLGSEVRKPEEVELGNIGMSFELDGEVKHVGSSAAILEHPARSLAAMANMLHERGEYLRAGQIVLAGAATAAEFVHAGTSVCLRADGLGEVRLDFSE